MEKIDLFGWNGHNRSSGLHRALTLTSIQPLKDTAGDISYITVNISNKKTNAGLSVLSQFTSLIWGSQSWRDINLQRDLKKKRIL